jgi:hypothetical protein
MGEENSYSLAAPQGVMLQESSLKIEHLAVSNWQLAGKLENLTCDPLPAWDWVWMALGWPLGHPRATPGPSKRHARVTLGSNSRSALFATKREKRPGGVGAQSAPIAVIAGIARDRKKQDLTAEQH